MPGSDRSDGSGDIPLALTPGNRIAWMLLWPHVRPWRMLKPEPTLRAIPDAADVAAILAKFPGARIVNVRLPNAPETEAPDTEMPSEPAIEDDDEI